MGVPVEKQKPDLQSYPNSSNLVTPFQVGHADIGAMASMTVRKLHTIQRVRFQDASVIIVLEGSKSISDPGCPKHAETGDVAVIPAGTIADVTSRPKPSQAVAAGALLRDLSTRGRKQATAVSRAKEPASAPFSLKLAWGKACSCFSRPNKTSPALRSRSATNRPRILPRVFEDAME
jgi:hypothetical protein